MITTNPTARFLLLAGVLLAFFFATAHAATIQTDPFPADVDVDERIEFRGFTNIWFGKFEWDFGDGSPLTTGHIVSHRYRSPGTYRVHLAIYDWWGIEGIEDEAFITVRVRRGGGGGGGGRAAEIIRPHDRAVFSPFEPIRFEGISDLSGASFRWNFGDGGTGFGPNITRSYSRTGSFTVTLEVRKRGIFRGSDTITVVIRRDGVDEDARIIRPSNDDRFNRFETIRFEGRSNISGATYEWDFDDGRTAVGRIVNHSYSRADTYRVTLTVRRSGVIRGRDRVVIHVGRGGGGGGTVEITRPPNNSRFDVDELVTFTARVRGGSFPCRNFRFEWDFGDGFFSQGDTVLHRYRSRGTYTAEVTVRNICSGHTEVVGTDRVRVIVEDGGAANVEILAPGNGTRFDISTLISFSGRSSLAGTALTWNFGDGQTRFGSFVRYAYSRPGTYTVTLTGRRSGRIVGTDTIRIHIDDRGANVEILRPADGSRFDVFDTIRFEARSVSGATYSWNFGDGRTGNGRVVHHSYGTDRTYTVTLTVRRGGRIVGSDSIRVHIDDTRANVEILRPADGSRFDVFDTIRFDARSVTGGTYSWNFGDGRTGSGRIVNHVYTRTGTFTVSLTVRRGGRVVGTDSIRVTIDRLRASVEIVRPNNNDVFDKGENIRFEGRSSVSGVTYHWTFGDGRTGTGRTPNHTYTREGTFTVTLIVRRSGIEVGRDTIRLRIEDVCERVEQAVASWQTDDRRINDAEMLQALRWFHRGTPVPGTCGEVIDAFDLADIVDTWLNRRLV